MYLIINVLLFIFTIFVFVLTISNVSFLVNFYVFKEKHSLAKQLETIDALDLNNNQEILNKLSEISENNNFDVEINGKIG